MATNAQRQAAFKEKMRQAGKKQITIWVDPEQQAVITALLAGMEKLLVTTLRPKIDLPRKIKKKRDTREVWQIKNDAVWEAHRTEITQRYAAGHKPSVIAAWLNTLGFVGSGATLNGYIKRF